MSAALDGLTLAAGYGIDMGESGAPQRMRIHARHSTWSGADLRLRLQRVFVSGLQFARMTGVNAATFKDWASGKSDGGIPLWVELVVELLERCHDTRHYERRGGNQHARHSTWSGAELKLRLQRVSVSGRQFARMTGVNETTTERWARGKSDGDIPLWVELVVELLDRCPDTRHRERREAGRPKEVLDGAPRQPPNFPPPRAKPWPEMQRLLETAKPTVSTMTDAELLAEYHAFDAMDDGPATDDDRGRWDEIADECMKRGLV